MHTNDATSRVLAFLVGDRGRLREISFKEHDVEFRCRVHEDSLWIAIKENLVLGEYEREGLMLPGLSGVVVDAGAHVGLFALLASVYADEVLALEAHPRNFALLQENVERNGRNVSPRHCALWSTDGVTALAEGLDSASGSVLGGVGERFTVPSVSLDSVVSSTGPVDLLKLDIEGAEFDVLDSASEETLRQISTIVAELHLEGRHERVAPTLERLRSVGFRVVVRKQPVYHWRETMAALWRHRSRLQGGLRLRLTVAALYSVLALGGPVFHLRDRFPGRSLRSLYATRGQ